MAKKQLIDYTKHQQELFKRIEGYASDVRAIYQDYFEQVIKLVKGTELVDGLPFSFSDYGYSQKVTPIFRKMYSRVYQTIRGGIQKEWLKSNENNDELVKAVFGENSIEDNHFARFFVRNMEAMDSFFKRKSEYGGLNLSQRVWNYTGQYKEELENALDLAMGEGTPANRVSARVKQYLNDPDRFYRRFRVKTGEDDNGNPIYGRKWKRRIWDKVSESYKWIDAEPKHYTPGKGIYRSSARNAQRLTRTETNMAYRAADQDRWQHMDFILGYRVKLSKNHPVTDICDDLSAANDDNESQRGIYPKNFVFKGWHPQCRCFVVPILAKEDEFVAMQKALLNGEEPLQPSGVITEPNEHFKEWVKNNRGRIEKAKTLPYWVKDNKKAVEKAMADDLIVMRSVSEPNFENDSKIQEFVLPTIKQEQMPTDKQLIEIDEVKSEHVSFRLDTGGSVTVEEERIANANKNKQERLKFVKEHRMCRTLAAGGFNVVLLNEVSRVSSSDILIDGVKADLKATKGANNIGKYGKKAINKQGANLVIFEFEEITDEVHRELNNLAQKGIHGKYYKKGGTTIQTF